MARRRRGVVTPTSLLSRTRTSWRGESCRNATLKLCTPQPTEHNGRLPRGQSRSPVAGSGSWCVIRPPAFGPSHRRAANGGPRAARRGHGPGRACHTTCSADVTHHEPRPALLMCRRAAARCHGRPEPRWRRGCMMPAGPRPPTARRQLKQKPPSVYLSGCASAASGKLAAAGCRALCPVGRRACVGLVGPRATLPAGLCPGPPVLRPRCCHCYPLLPTAAATCAASDVYPHTPALAHGLYSGAVEWARA